MPLVSQSRLRDALNYDPDTGCFTRKTSAGGFKVGSEAGSVNAVNGYRYISVDRKYYLAHRLAWLYEFGEWPKGSIDHINHVRTDNRITNLRDVTPRQNNLNLSLAANNTSGSSGVIWDKSRNMWIAVVKQDRRNLFLGRYDTKEYAEAARCGAMAVLRHQASQNRQNLLTKPC
jgi:hypothetical protein